MKIVRVTISTRSARFYYDRAFEEGQSDTENVDAAIKFFTQLYEEQKVVAVMLMMDGAYLVEDGKRKHDPYLGAVPAMLNLGQTEFVAIENAGIYEQ